MSKTNQIKKQKASKSKNHFRVRKLAKIEQNKVFRKVRKENAQREIIRKVGLAAANLVIANSVGLSGVGLYGILTQAGTLDTHVALFVIGLITSVIASGVHVYCDVAFKDSG